MSNRTWILGVALAVGVLSACGNGDAPQASTATVAPVAQAAPEIMALYNRSCISCHRSGAGGAPRTGDTAAWQPRLEQGLDLLLEHTIAGYKGMPPMGMCMDCNEDQFVALIEYMAGQTLD